MALTTAFAYSPVACPPACPTAWPPTRPPGRRRGRLPAQPPARAAARPRANLLWQLARRPPAHQPGHVPSCLPQCLPARLRAQPAASLTASPPACLRNWPPAGPPAISTLQLFRLPLLGVVNGHCVCCSEAARINASWLLSLRAFERQRGFAKELLSDRLFTEAGKSSFVSDVAVRQGKHACCVTKQTCPLRNQKACMLSGTADIPAARHSGQVFCAARQTCLLCATAGTSVALDARNASCTTQLAIRLRNAAGHVRCAAPRVCLLREATDMSAA